MSEWWIYPGFEAYREGDGKLRLIVELDYDAVQVLSPMDPIVPDQANGIMLMAPGGVHIGTLKGRVKVLTLAPTQVAEA